MAKTKKQHVSVNELDKYISTPSEFIIRLPGDETQTEIKVKSRLSIAEVSDFVNSVISDIFDNESGFSYYFKDFAIRKNTIAYYTNITVPQNIEKQYELVHTDILDRIRSEGSFDNDTYETLIASIDKQIEFEKEKYLCELRRETEELIEETKTQGEQLVAVFSQFAKSFENIDPDQMAGLVTKLANMEKLDEKSIVDALVEKGDKNAGILEVE